MVLLYLALLESPEDEPAFIELYHTNLPELTKVGQRFFTEKSLIEDALQLTWESVAKNFTKITSLPRHETVPYLVTMMKNKCKDILRSEKKYTELLPDEDAVYEDGVDDMVHIKSEYQEIVALIRKMSDTYREVLERRLVLEESNREIASKMGISEALVAKRFSRGRALLIEILSDEGIEYE